MVLGILAARLFSGLEVWFWLFAIAAVLLIVFSRWIPLGRWQWLAIALLPCFAAWRYELQEAMSQSDRLHSIVSNDREPVVVEATIESTPQWRTDLARFGGNPALAATADEDLVWQTSYTIRVLSIRDGHEWLPDKYGLITLNAQGRIRDLLPGDRVRCYMVWQRIGPPTNPGQFDFAVRNRAFGIWVRGQTETRDQVEFLGKSDRLRIDRFIAWLVIRADRAFHRHIAFGQAPLASALVLGQRDQIDWELQQSFLVTGTIHMLAISGMHIEMVAISIFYFCLLAGVPKRVMLASTIVLVVTYSLLCGGNPPVARAAIVVVVLSVARWIGKTTHAMNLLGLAACLILLYRPQYWFEIGTQLSFLAVLVLILLGRDLSKIGIRNAALDALVLESIPPWKRGLLYTWGMFRSFISSSFWVWWLTMPLVLFRFHVVSPIAVLLNAILWFPMLFALLSGLGLLALGWMNSILADGLGWICGFSLFISERIVEFAASWPLGHFWLGAPQLIWVLIFYIFLIAGVGLFGFGRNVRRAVLVSSLVWFAAVVIPQLAKSYDIGLASDVESSSKALNVTWIDVGHGTSVLIETPDDEVYLYDAGQQGNPHQSHRNIADVLWYAHVVDIDGLFLSHADSDHFNAISGLSRRFRIDELIASPTTLQSTSSALCETLVGLDKNGVARRTVKSGDSIRSGQVSFEVLHPDSDGVNGSDNANSLCLLIEYAGRKLLLPGDIEKEGTKVLISGASRVVDVLMAPHHGSLAEDPGPVLDWCDPKVIVISGGTRARHPRVRERFARDGREVFITAVDHAIRCSITARGDIEFRHWIHPSWAPVELR